MVVCTSLDTSALTRNETSTDDDATLKIIAPYAFAMALVGLLESLMTAKLVDDITESYSDKTREGWGQGAANVVSGFFGGMGVRFFASSNDLIYQFDYANDPQNVIIDLSEAQIYDSSTVDAIVLKYHNKGKQVEIIGMNEPSQKWHELSGKL